MKPFLRTSLHKTKRAVGLAWQWYMLLAIIFIGICATWIVVDVDIVLGAFNAAVWLLMALRAFMDAVVYTLRWCGYDVEHTVRPKEGGGTQIDLKIKNRDEP